MQESQWEQCLAHLESEVSQRQFDTFLRPLQVLAKKGELRLFAPNEYVRDEVEKLYRAHIERAVTLVNGDRPCRVNLEVGSRPERRRPRKPPGAGAKAKDAADAAGGGRARSGDAVGEPFSAGIRSEYSFGNFIEGKSNQLARAAAMRVAENPGRDYNPLLIYGGNGLGKTHLLYAIGNAIVAERPRAHVAYLRSERFVEDMVGAIRHHQMDRFKQRYRSIEALLIDDIQFFAGKQRSQEEFFHTFEALMQNDHQIVLVCDKHPKEVDQLDKRLTTRFESGISFAIEPPDLETRAAILMSKAAGSRTDLPDDVALFIARQLKSDVRELESALRRVMLSADFQARPITIDLCREVLRDLLAIQDRLVTIENIQKTVAEYYNLRVADLCSRTRTRYVAQARQLAMSLARELTNRSFPEIGKAFGDRDHTTVLHACRKIETLRGDQGHLDTDYRNLMGSLTT